MVKQDIAIKVLQQVVKLPVVKVNREKFLVEKFSKELDKKDIAKLLEQGPPSLLPQETLDRVARSCIKDNVLRASGTSVLAGLPGGILMALTIPTDVAQFYAFSLKLAQELGYIYGYDNLWASRNELSEEAKNTLLLYLGVMFGVNGAGALLRSGGVTVAKHVMKTVPQKALAKTLWYPILEKVLKIFGVTLTRRGLAKGMGKAIPILGGFISGGLTFATMKPMGERLQKELSKLVNYSEVQYQNDMATIRKEAEIVEAD
ncbi:hypothetical protein TZ94_00852 [Streptococcus infantis]|uniref:Uncharacterized protein n=1 Tax=Streptococcus infantis TaxID=68892 RepID=A0A0F2E1Q9_9STRE|nr:hypothetical protein [Streptococcus infantis]KJQ76354.1 hypothetical protein TZ94_00852 [Streptococcus infantis]